MKKAMFILFRIIYVVIFLGVIFLVIFFNINRMRGNLFVTVNGEEYLPEHLECRYEDGTEEAVSYKVISQDSGAAYQNHASRYGMCEYTFSISNEEVNIEPKIRVFKTNWYKIYVVNIDVEVYEDDGVWNADVSVETNTTSYQETFYDIENQRIEMRVE